MKNAIFCIQDILFSSALWVRYLIRKSYHKKIILFILYNIVIGIAANSNAVWK